MILFTRAIGRAYINLYNPFLPLKDEIEALTSVNIKSIDQNIDSRRTQQKAKGDNNDGNNNTNSEPQPTDKIS